MKRKLFTLLALFLFAATAAVAQDKMAIKDEDGNVLFQFNDEGEAGSITLPGLGAVPSVFTDKIYSIGGELYFNGEKLSTPWSTSGSNLVYTGGVVGVGTGAPNNNAVLDIDAAGNDKGVLLPRLTTAQREAINGLGAPDEGLIVYDETTDGFWFWSGSQWNELGGAAGGGDDLGDHTATQAIDLSGHDINNGGTVTATTFVGDGSGLTGITVSGGDNLGDHTATQTLNLNGNYLSGDGESEGVFVDADGRVGIGTDTPNEQLEITGNFRLPATTSTTGVIYSGGNRLIHTFGSDNFFAGVNAGNLSVTGVRNTGIGAASLTSLTTGEHNSGVGFATGANIRTGSRNLIFGYQALTSVVSGNDNTGVGHRALSNTIASGNTAVGSNALRTIGLGSNNTAIGFEADAGAGDITNATAIGANAVVDASNKVRIGDSNVTLVETDATISASAFVGDGSGLTGIAGDDLGNHTATQALDLAGNDITNGGTVTATALDVNGTVTATAFVGDGSTLTGISGDNLGNHIATQALDLAGNEITNGGTVTATAFVGDGTGLSGISGDNLGNHTATQVLDLANNDIINGGTVTASAFIGDGSGLSGISGDDLGNHTATQALNLNGNWLSGDGGSEGVFVDNDGNTGIGTNSPVSKLSIKQSSNTIREGLRIQNAANDWVGVLYMSPDGLVVNSRELGTDDLILNSGGGNVGIGITTPVTTADIRADASGPNVGAANYVVNMRNTHTNAADEQGVLILQFDANLTGNSGNANWIQFAQGNTASGAIENNTNGAVVYSTGGADYAELLERLDHKEQIEDGDVVGVFGGMISRRTEGADWVMAVSDQAAVLGNTVYDSTRANYEIVSFIGQVPVWVDGKVNKGDYIVASGKNDGSAIAVSPQKITPFESQRIVGRAWEAKDTEARQQVNTVVGLPESASTTLALARELEAQKDELAGLRTEVAAMKSQNQNLMAQKTNLEERLSQIELAVQRMNAEAGSIPMDGRK